MTTREEFRVWRRVQGTDRRWTTCRTRKEAEQVITELRGDGSLGVHRIPLGIERVMVTEESDGIDWQEGTIWLPHRP